MTGCEHFNILTPIIFIMLYSSFRCEGHPWGIIYSVYLGGIDSLWVGCALQERNVEANGDITKTGDLVGPWPPGVEEPFG